MRTERGLARNLKRASRQNDAPIWARIAELASSPARSQRALNLNKIARFSHDGDTLAVPGKVLGTGAISHKVTIASFSISRMAAGKIRDSGGSVVNFEDLIERHPTGKGVVLLG